MNRVGRYLNKIADKLSIESEIAFEAGHNATIGDNREKLINNFFSKHLPFSLMASTGGLIIDSNGSESKQIDIIVSNHLGINFSDQEKMFIGIESVASAITVKSILDKTAIYDCLHNLASIPQLDPNVLSFRMLKEDSFDEFSKRHPALFIFAYDGVSLKTCKEHVNSFYNEYPDIPLNRRPRGIFVNKQYCIIQSPFEKFSTTGVRIPPYTFFGYSLDDDRRGYGLSLFLNEISHYTDWLPFMSYSNNVYFNRAFDMNDNKQF